MRARKEISRELARNPEIAPVMTNNLLFIDTSAFTRSERANKVGKPQHWRHLMGHKHFLFNFFFSIKKSLGLTQNFLSYVIKIKEDVHAPSACAQHKKPVLHEPLHV